MDRAAAHLYAAHLYAAADVHGVMGCIKNIYICVCVCVCVCVFRCCGAKAESLTDSQNDCWAIDYDDDEIQKKKFITFLIH